MSRDNICWWISKLILHRYELVFLTWGEMENGNPCGEREVVPHDRFENF